MANHAHALPEKGSELEEKIVRRTGWDGAFHWLRPGNERREGVRRNRGRGGFGPKRHRLLRLAGGQIPHQGEPGTGPVHQPLEERIAGQPVGAVDPRGRHFASGTEPRDRTPAPRIHGHPTHVVVGRRGYGNEVTHRVDAMLAAEPVDTGKAIGKGLAHRFPGIEKGLDPLLHGEPEAPGDLCTGRQVPSVPLRIMEPATRGIHQEGSLPPNGLGHQRKRVGLHPERRGVELDELHPVEPCTGHGGEGETVAEGIPGSRGAQKEPARPSGGQERERRIDRPFHPPVVHVPNPDHRGMARSPRRGHRCRGRRCRRTRLPREKPGHAHPLEDAEPRTSQCMFREDPGHLPPGPITQGMHDAPPRVGALEAQGQASLGGPVEADAHAGQLPHPVRTFGGQDLDPLVHGERHTGSGRIQGVKGRRVLRVQCRRDATLGQGRGPVAAEPAWSEDHDPGPTRRSRPPLRRSHHLGGRRQGGSQAGDPRPHHHHVGLQRANHPPDPRPTASILSTAVRALAATSGSTSTGCCR